MNTTLNVKIDVQTKQSRKEFADELGVPVSSLVNGTIRQMLRDRRVVFSTVLEPTPYLEEIMRETEEDLKTGKNIITFDSNDEALAHPRAI